MKRIKSIWNYIDMLAQTFIIVLIIMLFYFLAESLEKYIYRYTIFPFIAVILIFILGTLVGKGIERTRRGKPTGFLSKKMAKSRKRKNMFIFQDDGETYTPHKEIIEDIRSGEIVHVKQFNDDVFDSDEFREIYRVKIDDIVDNKMDEKLEDKESKK